MLWGEERGRLWAKVKSFFSGFKRLFGEVVCAKRFERMVKEIEMKVWVFDLMLGLSGTQGIPTAGDALGRRIITILWR